MKTITSLFMALAISVIGYAQNTFPASGNVGIGTTSPGNGTKLQVAGRGLFTGGSFDPGDSSPAGVGVSFEGAVGHIEAVQTGVRSAPLELQHYGNVGIGTASPTEKLQVAGNISVVTGGYNYDVAKSVSVSSWNFSSRPAGWYRIATNIGDRTNGTFELRENSDHSTLKFIVGSSFSSSGGLCITVLSHNWFSAATFQKIRLLNKGIYDPQYLEVYINPHNNDNQQFWAFLEDNLQNSGWILSNYEGGSIPGGYTSTEYSVDDLFVAAGAGDAKSFRVSRNGNVGIGTTAPAASLDVGGTAADGALRIVFARQGEGNSNNSGTFLGVRAWGTQNAAYNGKMFSIENTFYGSLNSSIEFYRGNSVTGGFITFTTNDGSERVRIDNAGNVGIGTTTPQEKLSVNGRVRAKEVIVDTNWSDFVFAKGYYLAPLSEVEQHIQKQGHLPGVPSAQEVAEKGVSVGDMQAVLLAKIEELTLHVIQQEKDQSALRIKVERQDAEIAVLKAVNAGLSVKSIHSVP